MADLLVDMTVLERLRAALGEAADDLERLGRRLRAASARELGSSRLDDAADNFFEEWGYGTTQLAEAATIVARQVDEALRVYEQADEDLAAVFRSRP